MDKDAFILAMWLRFLLAPNKSRPDIDGAFDLGEVGSVRGKNWTKATPYSIATKKMGKWHSGPPCRD